MLKTCTVCQKEYEGHGLSKYCRPCRMAKSGRYPGDYICIVCGGEFQRITHRSTTCSGRCERSAYRLGLKTKNAKITFTQADLGPEYEIINFSHAVNKELYEMLKQDPSFMDLTIVKNWQKALRKRLKAREQ